MRRPSPDEIRRAAGATVPDLVAPGLAILFCGINPSLYSAAVGYHFARPGNRFWPALHAAGLTGRRLSPWEGEELLAQGLGITNVVARATARADELSRAELRDGWAALGATVRDLAPRLVAVLGIGAYRTAAAEPGAALGRQAALLGGVPVHVLPNPSGLNAHYRLDDLARLYGALRGGPPP